MDSPLPGKPAAYCVRSGDGVRYALGAQLATVIARRDDTGGLLEAATVSGGRGAASPRHRHVRGHEALLVTEGRLELRLDDRLYEMAPGDYASIPAGVAHAYTMRGHYTRFLQWMVGGALAESYAETGTATTASIHDESGARIFALPPEESSGRLDVIRATDESPRTHMAGYDAIPEDAAPYVVESGDGERLVAGDQLFTFLCTSGQHGRPLYRPDDGGSGRRAHSESLPRAPHGNVLLPDRADDDVGRRPGIRASQRRFPARAAAHHSFVSARLAVHALRRLPQPRALRAILSRHVRALQRVRVSDRARPRAI